jgi:hypothetical protein
MLSRYLRQTCLLLVFAACATSVYAQFELPDEIFQRTILIRYNSEQATAFKFDHGGRIYLVTTRHFGKKLPPNGATIQLWHLQKWNDLPTLRTLLPSSNDVDLAVLETQERIDRPFKVVKSEEVLTTGQSVWYMGWLAPIRFPPPPKQMPKTQRAVFPEIPNVSLGTISAIDPTRADLFEIRIRGHFAQRLAGGPIVYWSPVHRDYELVGVIKRNERDAISVPVDGKPPVEVIKTGILMGYSIDSVVETIEKSEHP